ncbi:MAG TPA: helix-turn-helix domain-containing protein [Candidatus Limnocylindria bacterium]|nr:helix-turn-helix domain-containing protein [Candidatus Limnocylindria bacterium]
MREVRQLFEKALGLTPPWRVTRSEFDPQGKRLDLFLDFERGARFRCPHCGAEGCPVHDAEDKEWRHLNFRQYPMYRHARVPRIRGERDGVRQVALPWARPGPAFTHLFEACVMTLAAEMPVKGSADLLGEHDTRIWRLVHHHVDQARATEDCSEVDHVAVAETSRRHGHHDASQFCDLGRSKLLFATTGKDAATFARFKEDLVAHGGDPNKLVELCVDMSPAFT